MTPESIEYQPERAELRNYIINLSKSSSREYSRDVKWVVEGLAAIHFVPPLGTYELWFKTLVIVITPPAVA